MRMKHLTVLTVSYKTPDYISLLIKGFETFKPDDLEIKYIVVENSNLNYSDQLLDISKNINFLNNNCSEIGSYANASGVESGKPHIDTEYCFVCHSDVMVVDKCFFSYIDSKISDGYKIIGTGTDTAPFRIQALHISGILLESNLLKKINTYPVEKQGIVKLDVGDTITQYARDNKLPYTCMDNTINNPKLCENINEPYKSWGPNCGVDRAVDDEQKVTFIHLGRGTPKHQGIYGKPNKKTKDDWVYFCNNLINQNNK
jgi:hypothetical protein